jgi:hypothetical protein
MLQDPSHEDLIVNGVLYVEHAALAPAFLLCVSAAQAGGDPATGRQKRLRAELVTE